MQSTSVLEEVDESIITGASLAETIAATVYVDSSRGKKSGSGTEKSPFLTIRAGLHKAEGLINSGTPTKLLIASGEYRESGLVLTPSNQGKDVLLIIEGQKAGSVIVSGSDLYSPAEWKMGKDGIATHSWKYQFGNFAYFWEGHTIVSHRSEQVFVNGSALRQKILENYRYQVNTNDQITNPEGFVPNEWQYTGYSRPRTELENGTFGVCEKIRNGRKMALKLPAGVDFYSAKIEVSVRRDFLKLQGEKNNLVLRNVVFQHFANTTNDTETGVIIFGTRHQNVLIENCDFLWNNAFGLHFRNVYGLTLRNCRCNYNGASGVGLNTLQNVIFDRVETNYNCWKVYWGGQTDWYTAGAKIHETNDMLYVDSQAIGNTCPGIWYDVHCKNIIIRACFAAFNTRNVFVELSNGPYLVDQLVSVFAKHYCFYTSVVGRTVLQDSLLYNNGYGTVAEVIWFERNDQHSLLQNLVTKYHRFSGSVFASGGYHTFLLGDRNFLPAGSANQKTFSYDGKNNHFFHPEAGKNFYYLNENRTLVPCTFEEWQNGKSAYSTSYSETGAHWGDPQFSNPEQLDFTLLAGSPLISETLKAPFKKFDSEILQRTGNFFKWCGWDQVVQAPPNANQKPNTPYNIRARFTSRTTVLLEWEVDSIADGVVLDNEWDEKYVWRNEFGKQVRSYTLNFCNIKNPQRYKLYSYNSLGYSEPSADILPSRDEIIETV